MRTQNAKLPTSLQTSLLRAERIHGRIYCLIEMNIFDKTVYCISISGEEFAAELVGDDSAEAQRIFEQVNKEGIPSYQLLDVVSDSKREKAF